MHHQPSALDHPSRPTDRTSSAITPPRQPPPPAARVAAWLVGIFAVCMAIQLAHTFEHTLQTMRWMFLPREMWMTPWATALAQELADLTAGGFYMAGMELLHLIGNVIFQLGIILGLAIARRRLLPTRRLHQAAWLQGLHVLEHVALTVTVFTGGVAIGLSSLFGLLEPMTPAWIAVRVLFHFTINLVAYWLAVTGSPRPLRDPATRGRHERPSQPSWERVLLPQPTMSTAASPQPASSWPALRAGRPVRQHL